MDPTTFETHPSRYRHWKLGLAGDTATLIMDVDGDHPHRPGYELKLNSYDLAVDLELADAIQRLRFEHPDAPHRPGYELKLNSYDLAVDLELADAIQRLRFEHPEVKVVVITA